MSPQAREAIRKEVRAWEDTGRIRRVTKHRHDPTVVLYTLPIFAIQQGTKIRVVWDARPLNEQIHLKSFKMESIATAARVVRPGDWLFTIDMWNGYHQRK